MRSIRAAAILAAVLIPPPAADLKVPPLSAVASLQGRPASGATRRVETLRSSGGIPPHIVGAFHEPVGFQQVASGQYFVFDRRGHTVYGLDAATTAAWKLVEIGHEEGRAIEPTAFDTEPNGTFVLADAPGGRERIQIFTAGGARVGGFTLPGRTTPRVTLGAIVLNGIGTLQYTGQTILISQPETGSLITEYSLSGGAIRTIGALRATGQEPNRDVHLALNSGLPLIDPRGGFYFVFQTGAPMLRKYDRSGTLVFERHVEGRELDETIAALPTTWPMRKIGETEVPLVLPTVRTAAVDPAGHLWISFMTPFTYVYDPDGEKTRVVQFRGAGPLAPASLFFTADGRLLVTPGCYAFDVRR